MISITHESIIANVCKRNGKQWAECLNINRPAIKSYQIFGWLLLYLFHVSFYIIIFHFVLLLLLFYFLGTRLQFFSLRWISGLLNNKTIFYSSQQNLEKQTGNCLQSTAWKCLNTEFFSGPYFPVFGLNTGKFGPEKNSVLGHFSHSEDFI